MSALDPRAVAMHHTGSGPPLVLLHCLGVDHRFWDFARLLEADFTVWRYDLPGHGTTPVPQHGYGIEDLSAQLAELFVLHGIARAHVAGISLGGLITQHFAASHPELIDRAILIDTTPRYVDDMRAMWGQRAAAARGAGVASLIEGLLPIWFSAAAIKANADGVRYVREALSRCPGEGYALACEALARADLSDHAARITAPTLVVCGSDDIPSFLDAACWLASIIAGARLEWIPGARHASVLEQPDIAIALMREFLRG
jgi:3-oxoadipate enol-lactonase